MGRLTAGLIIGLLAAVGLGFQPTVPAASAPPGDALTTDEGQVDAGGQPDGVAPDFATTPPSTYPDDDQPPTVRITAPAQGAAFAPGQSIDVRGVTSDDHAVVAMTLQVGPNAPRPMDAPAPSPAAAAGDGGAPELPFHATATLGVGDEELVVRAYDVAGNEAEARVLVHAPPAGADDTPPTVEITSPADGFAVATQATEVRGVADDAVGVVLVEVSVDGGPPAPAQTDDHFATWSFAATLSGAGSHTITARALDVGGNEAQAAVTGTTSAAADTTPPLVTFTSPDEGAQTADDALVVTGAAADDSGVQRVDIRVGDGAYEPTTTEDGYATWSATVALAPGVNVLKVRARDTLGNTAAAPRTVTNPSGDQWEPPETYTLTWAAPSYEASTFKLDRAGLDALMPPGVAEQLVMLNMDVGPLLQSAVAQIRSACGPGWETADKTSSCPGAWSQAERNMYRLMTMTPANIGVQGTSIEGMEEIAATLSDLGLLDSFSDILATALGIATTDTIVSAASVAASLRTNVMETHPNVLPGGIIPVTMRDALTDMDTLAPRFDAVADHPGFLDSTLGATHAKVLDDDFTMTMVATSNLHWHDGVSLPAGKAYLPLVNDVTGPTFDDVLEFDFLSPDTFQVDGIVAHPTVDLVFKITEDPTWISIGDSRYPLPRGNSAAWDLAPYLLEHVLADAAFRDYEDRRAGCDLCLGADDGALLYETLGVDEAELVVGRQGYDKDSFIGGQNGAPEHFDFLDPNPPGWLRIWTLFSLGSPPAPQYVWDMILEVSEQRLLDGGVAQGAGNVRFPLTGLDVGLTGDEIKEAVRPTLESQKGALSDLLLGDYKGQALDFYLTRGTDGALWLTFVSAEDPVPPGTAAHAKPGFFADEALTQKVSNTIAGPLGGDGTVGPHENLAVGDASQTVYCADVAGVVHRVEVSPAGAASVTVTIRRRKGLPGGTP